MRPVEASSTHDSIESRTRPRYEAYLDVEIDTGWVRSDGTVLSLSEGGLFTTTDLPLVTGTRVNLAFELPDQRHVELSGEVIYRSVIHQRAGVGVKFVAERRSESAMTALSRWCRSFDDGEADRPLVEEPDPAKWSCVSPY